MAATTAGKIEDALTGDEHTTVLQEGNFPLCILLASCGSTEEMAAEVGIIPRERAHIDKRTGMRGTPGKRLQIMHEARYSV
jgi:hypothetical protein